MGFGVLVRLGLGRRGKGSLEKGWLPMLVLGLLRALPVVALLLWRGAACFRAVTQLALLQLQLLWVLMRDRVRVHIPPRLVFLVEGWWGRCIWSCLLLLPGVPEMDLAPFVL